MRVYLDACCLNRPFDDQSQERIRLESEAVLLILGRIDVCRWEWIGSEVLDFEIAQIPDGVRRERVRHLAAHKHVFIEIRESEVLRAKELETIGFHVFDALHLACAEAGSADVFLTTDDRLVRVALHANVRLAVVVRNPLKWLAEVMKE